MSQQEGRGLQPISIFCSYELEDEERYQSLEKHLKSLRTDSGRRIDLQDPRKILPGNDLALKIMEQLETADIILLLVSSDFMSSDYLNSREFYRAIERQANGEAHVIPIILRPVAWEEAPFAHLKCLPLNGKPVTEWPNEDRAFTDITKGIKSIIRKMEGDSHKVSTPSIPQMTLSFHHNNGKVTKNPILQEDSSPESEYRQLLLTETAIWFDSIFKQSTRNFIPIQVSFRVRIDAVQNYKGLRYQPHFISTLPPELHHAGIVQIYDRAGGELMILGEPGSGKTTVLLELVSDILERGQKNARYPMPVVLNLSRWAKKQKPLNQWIGEELFERSIPRKISQQWVNNHQIILLLDGLDEMNAKYRPACINAINIFRRTYGLIPMVVCSRSAEYFDQKSRLFLNRAVIIQPLPVPLIDAYLSNTGEKLEALRAFFNNDTVLQELASTPFMLSLLARAFYDQPIEDAFVLSSPTEKRRQVFAKYIASVLKNDTPYTSQKMISWLSHLARWQKNSKMPMATSLLRNAISRLNTSSSPDPETIVFAPNDAELIRLNWLPKESLNFIIEYGLFGGIGGGFGGFKSRSQEPVLRGALGALAGGATGGVVAILKSLIRLHWGLLSADCLPQDYNPFLEYAVKCELLYKIGNGYMFTHKLLRDYFAELDTI